MHLRPQDRPYWRAILRQRPLEDWPEFALPLVVQLARALSDFGAESDKLDAEGFMIISRTGERRRNPRDMVVTNLSSRAIRLMGMLEMAPKE